MNHERYNIGIVRSIRSSVVDVTFTDPLPAIHNRVDIKDRSIILEVQSHLDEVTVRCIALTATRGLSRGDRAIDRDNPIRVPVGDNIKGLIFNVLGNVIDDGASLYVDQLRSIHQPPASLSRQSRESTILATGIKAIDVLAPLQRGGCFRS